MSAKLEYRIAELERKLSRIIVYGTIAEIHPKKYQVRVEYDNHEGTPTLTGWLPCGTRRAGADREYWMLEENEQVQILSPSGDMAQGIVWPALFQDAFPINGNDPDIHRIDYKNGDFIEHDRKTGTYTLKMKKFRLIGSVEQTDGDMTSDGVSVQHHDHGGVKKGGDNTAEPNK